MNYKEVYELFKEALEQIDDICVVTEENVLFEKNKPTTANTMDPFVKLIFVPRASENITIGVGSIQKDSGSTKIEIHMGMGQGVEEGNEIADRIRAVLDAGVELAGSTQVVYVINTWREQGYYIQKRYIIPVYVKWECFTI